MSKFSVGDRVVVISDEMAFDYWLQRRGVVSKPDTGFRLSVRVVFEDGANACFHPDELEFEHVYDELSKPSEEVPEAEGADGWFFSGKYETSPEDTSSPNPNLVSSDDAVNHPSHYTAHPSGVECKDIIGHYSFFIGSAMKYLWRAGLKTEDPIEDLRKAMKNIEFEIERRMAEGSGD